MDSNLRKYKVESNGTEIKTHRVSATYSGDRIFEDGHFYEIGFIKLTDAADVCITSEYDLSRTVLLPSKENIDMIIRDNSIRCQIKKTGTYIFQPKTYKDEPLILFADPAENEIPDKQNPHVIWFDAGEHNPGEIELHSNDILYLAPGAVVNATLFAKNSENIRICGRGIISQRKFKRFYTGHSIGFLNCKNIHISGVAMCDPCGWNLVFRDCDRIVVENAKICGGRMINDDAIDVCNSTNVVIRDCFIRAQDDLIAVKGMPPDECLKSLFKVERTPDKTTDIERTYISDRCIENVFIENCIFWCDAANVFRIGYECMAGSMNNIVVRGCEVVHLCDTYRKPEEYWCNTVWYIQASHKTHIHNLQFENIHVHVDVPNLVLMKIVSMECPPYVDFGAVSDCVFRNISFTGNTKDFSGEIFVSGYDSTRKIQNIVFDNISCEGKEAENWPDIQVGSFTENIRFK